MDLQLSLAEKRLLLALPRDGSALPVPEAARKAGFSQEVEALVATSGPVRHGLMAVSESKEVRHAASAEAIRFQKTGLPERRAVAAIHAAGGRLPMGELGDKAGLDAGEVSVAIGWLRKKNWATMQKGAAGTELALVAGTPPAGADEALLKSLTAEPCPGGDAEGIRLLSQRGGLLVTTEHTARSLALTTAGQAYAKTLRPEEVAAAEEVSQVTPELLARWATLSPAERSRINLRPFDFSVPVAPRFPGKPHPLQSIIAEVRDIFVSLGFQEIAGDFVEPAFWNMDTLFIPQDHPAREMQDTFYLKEPAALDVPKDLWRTVRDVQTTGGTTGSTGWGGRFTEEESRRPLLRTHTTVTTIRHLAAHPKPPTKVFGVGRVFRNEAMDATHLPEFHQVEGIVVEEGATFATLIGVLREFYTRLGFPEVKFRPSYYPYTEPSLDVAVRWSGRWLELGGAGIFRPEVTAPLGVPCPVLAWGLGLERLAMMRLGLKDIRQIYVSDVQWLRESPLG